MLEPTGNTVHAGAVGTMNADVVYRGRLAHSARPWQGVNAIYEAAAALGRFAARKEQPVVVEGLEFHDTITVTLAHGGATRNVVPDEFRLAVNVRVAPGRDARDARAEVEALAAPGEVSWLDESPAAVPNIDAAGRARLHRGDRRRGASRSRPGPTSPRCRRRASRPSTTVPARRRRRTSATSGSRSPRSSSCEHVLAGYLLR